MSELALRIPNKWYDCSELAFQIRPNASVIYVIAEAWDLQIDMTKVQRPLNQTESNPRPNRLKKNVNLNRTEPNRLKKSLNLNWTEPETEPFKKEFEPEPNRTEPNRLKKMFEPEPNRLSH